MSPRVSVVVIFLDAEEFIAEAIRSVTDQTFESWELLLVDDGSTDGSTDVARQLVAEDPDRVRLLQHPGGQNRGMSASRNLGLQAAKGEFVAFLDADDVYLPEKLERQSALLDAHPEAAMVYGPTVHWHSWTGRAEDAARDYPRKLGVTPESMIRPPELVRRYLTRVAWPPGTCGVMVRRAAAERVGGFEERFTAVFEDQAFFYKLCLEFPVYVQADGLDRYRQHHGSACHEAEARGEWSPRPPNPADHDFVLWFQSYLLARDMRDAGVWRALRSRTLPYRHPLLFRGVDIASRMRRRVARRAAGRGRDALSRSV
jgi:glycosyltransferase involved in cell wall biosynthesis